MYTTAVIEIWAGTRIREYRPVGMAGYDNSVSFPGIGTQFFLYLFHQFYGSAGACGSAEANHFQRFPDISHQEPAKGPKLIVEQTSMVAVD